MKIHTILQLIHLAKELGDSDALYALRKAVEDDDELAQAGMSVVDDPDKISEDSAGRLLAEQEKNKSALGTSDKKRSRRGQWKPNLKNLRDEQQIKDIMDLMEQGYSEREAHRLAGAHREHSDFQQAMKSGVNPSPISNKMLEQLKPLAAEFLENAEKHDRLQADIRKNPQKYVSGQIANEHDKLTAGYKHAYNDFLNSEEMKGLRGPARIKAVREWKKQWREQNPGIIEGTTQLAGKHRDLTQEAKEARGSHINEIIGHLITGGTSTPGVSMAEATQHLGGSVDDESGAPNVAVKDRTASFAAQNRRLLDILKQEHMAPIRERKQLVDNHKRLQGSNQPEPSTPKLSQSEPPKTIIRRRPRGSTDGEQ